MYPVIGSIARFYVMAHRSPSLPMSTCFAFFLVTIIVAYSPPLHDPLFEQELCARSALFFQFPANCPPFFSPSPLCFPSFTDLSFALALILHSVFFHIPFVSTLISFFLRLSSLTSTLFSLSLSSAVSTGNVARKYLYTLLRSMSVKSSLYSQKSAFLFSALPHCNCALAILLFLSSPLYLSAMTIQQPVPAVFTLYPSLGPVNGGTAVYLTGTNLNTNGTYCKFSDPYGQYSVILGTDPTTSSVICETPPNSAGYYVVEVTANQATSFSKSKIAFLYTG